MGKRKPTESVSTREPQYYSSFKANSWGIRHNQCVLLFITVSIGYSLRACMGVALVGMVHEIPKHKDNSSAEMKSAFNISLDNGTNDDINLTSANITIISTINHETDDKNDDFEFDGFFNALLITPPYPRFRWTKKVQDAVLSSFFWGYTLLQIPSGQLAHRFGPRYLLAGAMLVNCLMATLTPIASYYGGWICAALCRLCQGLTQAAIFPGIHTVMGKWSPLEERGRMIAVLIGGSNVGAVLGLMVTGYISSSSFGWPGVFYFHGFLSGITGILVWIFLANSPAEHKSISIAERQFIEESLGQTGPKKKLPVPWKNILTSPGLLAINVAHIGHTWGHVVLYSEVPAYMAHVVGVDIKANGLLSALPFLLSFFASIIFSWIYDMIIVKKYLSVTQVRKLANSVGAVPPAMGLLLLGYVPQDIYYVESLLILICVFKVSLLNGFHINHVDISPNFAGTMMSISNFISNLVSAQAPMLAGAILTDVADASLWRIVFFITGALYFISNLIYVIWGTAEQAEWNDPPQYRKVAIDNVDE